MARDPVMGPISRPLDPKKPVPAPKPAPPVEEAAEAEVQPKVQTEDKKVQPETPKLTYEQEWRTELAMRPYEDIVKIAKLKGILVAEGTPKDRVERMILRHDGFSAPEPPPAPTPGGGYEENLPRYSVRVRRILESQGKL